MVYVLEGYSTREGQLYTPVEIKILCWKYICIWVYFKRASETNGTYFRRRAEISVRIVPYYYPFAQRVAEDFSVFRQYTPVYVYKKITSRNVQMSRGRRSHENNRLNRRRRQRRLTRRGNLFVGKTDIEKKYKN